MTPEQVQLQQYWDAIVPDDLDDCFALITHFEDGFYLHWFSPEGVEVDREPIGDLLEEAQTTLRTIAAVAQGWGWADNWFVTMDDIRRAEALLAQVPSLLELPDW